MMHAEKQIAAISAVRAGIGFFDGRSQREQLPIITLWEPVPYKCLVFCIQFVEPGVEERCIADELPRTLFDATSEFGEIRRWLTKAQGFGKQDGQRINV